MIESEELLDILQGRIDSLKKDIEGWQKPIPKPPYDSNYGIYIDGAIDQAGDEQKFLRNVIMKYDYAKDKQIKDQSMPLKERVELLRNQISNQVSRVAESIEEFGRNTYDEGFQQGVLASMCDEQRFLINYLDGIDDEWIR